MMLDFILNPKTELIFSLLAFIAITLPLLLYAMFQQTAISRKTEKERLELAESCFSNKGDKTLYIQLVKKIHVFYYSYVRYNLTELMFNVYGVAISLATFATIYMQAILGGLLSFFALIFVFCAIMLHTNTAAPAFLKAWKQGTNIIERIMLKLKDISELNPTELKAYTDELHTSLVEAQQEFEDIEKDLP